MSDEQYVICGEAAPRLPGEAAAKAVRLHLYGPENDHKITLKINELRQELYKEVPARFRDLLELAAYVFTADQASGAGPGIATRSEVIGVATCGFMCPCGISNSGDPLKSRTASPRR